MSKKIALVENMVSKAISKGAAHTANYEAKYNSTTRILEVVHYGTRILEYNLFTDEIMSWGGWSASDRDALNTVLDYCVNYTGSEKFKIRAGELLLA